MSQITWQTAKGKLATVKEGGYFEYQLLAKDSQGLHLTFSVISGVLSSGLQLFKSGLIQGVPVVEPSYADQAWTQTFTIRATNSKGAISDRTFSITINEIASPTIIPKNVSLGTVYDGYFLDTQLTAIELSPSAELTWTKTSGELPPGVILTPAGRLYGNIESFSSAAAEELLGWGNTGWNKVIWDSPTAATQTRTYQFKVQVADGTRYDLSTYTIKVQAKSLFTVDNTAISANDGILTIDTDNKHVPFITTLPSDLPEQRQDSNFAFKIEGKDLDGDKLLFASVIYGQSEFDQGPTLDRPNHLAGPKIPETRWDDKLQELVPVMVRDAITGALVPNMIDDPLHPADLDDESVLQTAAFDQYGFDQVGQSLPPGVVLDPVTGWLTGHLEKQVEERKTYTFLVYCYKKEFPASKSAPVTFTLTVLGNKNNTVTWSTPADLGEINNGAISELAISAVSNLGKTLNYRIVEGARYPAEIYSTASPGSHYDSVIEYTPQARSQLPQGLKLLPNGLIVGRASFEFFTLDGGSTTFDKKATEFDTTYQFSVTASDEIDGVKAATVASNKTFTIKVHNWNLTPYENIYLRALPSRKQRKLFLDVINDESIFPTTLLYRSADPWFGKSTDIKFLFAAGLAPSLASTYLAEMQNNHYTKSVNLANVKTAVALDENLNVKYEVVYIAVTDPATENNKSPAMSINRASQIKSPYLTSPFTVIYPNSLDNMKTEVAGVGYANRGALPDWMLDQQEDGRVLGFIRGVVLAYTKPGASKLIAFRLQQHKIDFNNIEFVSDRYQLDQTLSANFDIATQEFIPSKETTFDRLPAIGELHPYAGTVDFALTVPFDEINGRTLEYLTRAGSRDGVSFKSGQLAIFALQEKYSRSAEDDFALTKDSYDSNGFDLTSFNLSTIPKQYESPNDGWNIESGLYDAEVYAPGIYSGTTPYYDENLMNGFDPSYYDDSKYSPSSVIPGYLDHLLDPTIVNMRSGIWRVNVSADNVVTLEFVKTVNPMEYVLVTGGSSFGGSKVYYNPIIATGHTVPEYTLLTNKMASAATATRFDGGATCFYNNKDEYAEPGVRDAFLKFPKQNVYR